MEYSNWPDDLITEIFARLPVKSLLRFKCVCRNWYSLITSSFFVRKHLQENPTCLLIAIYGDDLSQSGTTIHVLPDKILPGLIPEKPNNLQIRVELDEIIGPVDGLFLLLKDSHMAMWNPAKREFRPLPPDLLKFTHSCPAGCFENIFGFGNLIQ
ncbi:putative F-box/kelch-repeat protein At1g12870 [Nicotiana sylvestris]|uniref:F-box/kelch-repeat protein At1g12870 n=1 Tax=Nicotiana sylvestris TaxID=4096 RepID=A0A1U7VI17_NICSY|nr:PREDICTED: putative F-box/kelch-repeat protein At1g12870 [Nicotiana sylvestris]